MRRLLCLLGFLLGAGIDGHAQAAPPAVPVTEVMTIATPKPGASSGEVRKLVPDEIRGLVRIYLDGKVEQMYMRNDRGAVILFLRAKSVDEAKSILEELPLVKGGFLNVEYVPVGPLMSLGALLETPAAAGH